MSGVLKGLALPRLEGVVSWDADEETVIPRCALCNCVVAILLVVLMYIWSYLSSMSDVCLRGVLKELALQRLEGVVSWEIGRLGGYNILIGVLKELAFQRLEGVVSWEVGRLGDYNILMCLSMSDVCALQRLEGVVSWEVGSSMNNVSEWCAKGVSFAKIRGGDKLGGRQGDYNSSMCPVVLTFFPLF
ncbi:hypothetical protein H5410_063411 [Solanum commersonii]|uniref:Uncharacterized protein n=1 Tax=Solanum commersonii TaxID=4109 RepID=A0A9J5WDR8_SOLCO|nr:hypothetical protein H5410_063411 [Solanum commersonii]